MIARIVVLLSICLAATLPAGEKPWLPTPGRDKAWKRDHQQLVQRAAKGDIDLYFLGDSLTADWTSTGRATWHLDLVPQKAASFGVSADRVQNILYRITRGGLPKISPKVFVLMLGTNNLAQKEPDSPEDVIRGIRQILTQIKKTNPSSQILLLSILPNGDDPESPVRKSILETNRKLAALADGKSIHFEDIHDDFLDEAGHWKKNLTTDHTHLSKAGYEQLYRIISPPLTDLDKK